MTITVAITSYKYSLFLSRAIESVISQTRKPDKIIVVNDDPTDHFMCQIISRCYPVEYIGRRERKGIVDNFNDILFNHISTQKVLFLGADNWLRPDALELMENVNTDIASSDIALVGTEVNEFKKAIPTVHEHGYYIWKFKPGNIENGNYIHGSSLYDSHLARLAGGYEINPNGKNSEEDWMLWRKMLKAGAEHVHVPEPLLYYSRHKGNFQK